mmetsp:Transcript_89300/g.213280  ORF Transcript_89300/g.213280 Transcript_89300/m.213280 type:complete len:223 (-) Transcript_89300:72-740(-)
MALLDAGDLLHVRIELPKLLQLRKHLCDRLLELPGLHVETPEAGRGKLIHFLGAPDFVGKRLVHLLYLIDAQLQPLHFEIEVVLVFLHTHVQAGLHLEDVCPQVIGVLLRPDDLLVQALGGRGQGLAVVLALLDIGQHFPDVVRQLQLQVLLTAPEIVQLLLELAHQAQLVHCLVHVLGHHGQDTVLAFYSGRQMVAVVLHPHGALHSGSNHLQDHLPKLDL